MVTKLLEVLYDMINGRVPQLGEGLANGDDSMPEEFLEDEESTTEKGEDGNICRSK